MSYDGGFPDFSAPAPDMSSIAEGSTMTLLAADSGGQPLTATAGLVDRLRDVRQKTDGFYSIAFRTPARSVGRRLDVAVRVSREGVRTRHRRLVRIATDAEATQAANVAALLAGEGENPLKARARVGRVTQARGGFRAPLEVAVPAETVLLVEEEGRHRGRLQFFLSVRDQSGNVASVEPKELLLDVPAAEMATLRKNGIRYRLELVVSPGTTEAAVTVADVTARAHSTVRFQVVAGAAGRPRP